MAKKRKKSNKKLVLIVSISGIILLIIAIAALVIAFANQNQEDPSTYSKKEVIEYLERRGYSFENTEFVISTSTTKYVYVTNKDNKIVFQRIYNKFVGTMYEWQNGDINKSWADMKYSYENNTLEEKDQERAFKKWIENERLTVSQLTEALDYYSVYGNVTTVDQR